MKNIYRTGFTLIEVALVIVVLGVIIAAGAELYSIQVEQKRQEIMKSRFINVQAAIAQYLYEKGHYPCPASYQDLPNTPQFGRSTDCTDTSVSVDTCSGGICVSDDFGRRVRIGALPIRDLNLSAEDMIDIYGNRLSYAVTEQLAIDLVSFDGIGAIDIVDDVGNTILSAAGTAHFALFSHGRDGVGAYTASGGETGYPCTSGAKDNENCDTDAVFRSTELSTARTSDRFDDQIRHTLQFGQINVSCPAGYAMTEIRNRQPICVSFGDIIASVLGSFSCPADQAVISFSSTGQPRCEAITALGGGADCSNCGECGDTRIADMGHDECDQVCTVGGWASVRCWDGTAGED